VEEAHMMSAQHRNKAPRTPPTCDEMAWRLWKMEAMRRYMFPDSLGTADRSCVHVDVCELPKNPTTLSNQY